ncbi:MAG: hypothetical protein ACT443_10325 [Gemmatimonadota bacterium]
MKGITRAVRWWARGWAQFVEASRGPMVDRLVGPNPWGETPRGRGGRSQDA